jgi:hypothetical protein
MADLIKKIRSKNLKNLFSGHENRQKTLVAGIARPFSGKNRLFFTVK